MRLKCVYKEQISNNRSSYHQMKTWCPERLLGVFAVLEPEKNNNFLIILVSRSIKWSPYS